MSIPSSDFDSQVYRMIERRVSSKEVKSFQFKHQYKPGLIKYFTIELDKKYRINSDTKRINGSVVEVLSFVYKKGDNVQTSAPIGVEVKFMRNNQLGTYYDLHELVEVE